MFPAQHVPTPRSRMGEASAILSSVRAEPVEAPSFNLKKNGPSTSSGRTALGQSASLSARQGRNPAPRLRRTLEREQGFTLVELLVVIVIIGLLATIVAVNVIPAGNQARVEKAKADIAVLEQALEQYRLDNMTYPAANDGLNALVSPPPGLAQPERYRPGGYIKKLPDDPWGRPYHYAAPGKRGPFDIYSLGADGQSGGDGENADIYSSDI